MGDRAPTRSDNHPPQRPPRPPTQASKSLEAGGGPFPHISASGSGHGLSSLPASVDPGLLFASNQTEAETVATGLSMVNGTRPLIDMDYQQAAGAEGHGLLSPAEAAARAKSRRLVYMCGFCASLTSILLGYDVRIASWRGVGCVLGGIGSGSSHTHHRHQTNHTTDGRWASCRWRGATWTSSSR